LKSDLNLDDFMMKVFYRDYMKEPEVIEDYKFPPKPFIPKILPSKEELKIFYDALQDKHKLYFIMLASSGLRVYEPATLG